MLLFFLLFVPTLISAQSLVLIGGGFTVDDVDIINTIIEQAGGKDAAKIGVLTMAADNPESDANKQIGVFQAYGVEATWIPITQSNNGGNLQENVDLVRQQTGLYFGTGTRSRVIRALRPNGVDTLVMTAIRELFKSGEISVISGNSAGMATLGSVVGLMSGETYPSLSLGTGTYDPDGGLRLFEPTYMLDGQFSDQGREGRLVRALQDTRDLPLGTTTGIGIDPDVALFVTDIYTRPIGTVIGNVNDGGVHIYDVKNMIFTPSTTVDYQRVSTSFITRDDQIDLTTGKLTLAKWKGLVTGEEYFPNAVPSNDILSSKSAGQWRSTALKLIDNKVDKQVTSLSLETGPQFQVVHDSSLALSYGGTWPYEGRQFLYAYTNVLVSIREAK